MGEPRRLREAGTLVVALALLHGCYGSQAGTSGDSPADSVEGDEDGWVGDAAGEDRGGPDVASEEDAPDHPDERSDGEPDDPGDDAAGGPEDGGLDNPVYPFCLNETHCESGEFCSSPAGSCYAPGSCTPRSEGACADDHEPVCGCDGATYGNDCERMRAGSWRAAFGVGPCWSP
ncbi:MAG: hypothetical protein HY905_05345 [Deltaproteobacteria bacterium]|nr:hypothetical protein [Deltaproteobacteria bacterium]